MITTQIAKNRINQLIKQDNQSDDKVSRNAKWALIFIQHHLNAFFAKYAEDSQLSMQQASQKVNSWDVQQWKQAVDTFDMSKWPQDATDRVKAYAASASVNKGHMMTAISSLAALWLTTKHEAGIQNRISLDQQQQIKWVTKFMKMNPQQEKKAYSIITQPETQAIWSRNLWSDTDALARDVENLVNKHLRHGMSIQDLDSMLKQHQNMKQFNPNQSIGDRIKQMEFNTRRIVRTESSRLVHEVNVSTYQQVGITMVNFTNQPGACLLCQDLQAQGPYKIDDCPDIPGSSHPNCRCIITPAGDSHSRFITGNHLY